MMENGKAYFKNLGCLQRKIFESVRHFPLLYIKGLKRTKEAPELH